MKLNLFFTLSILLSGLLLTACESNDDAGTSIYADIVVSAPGATGSGYGDSSSAVDGAHGRGCTAQNALDVYSLSNDPAETNTSIILRWSGRRVLNGIGTDFTVFENPFDNSTCNSGTRFMDQLIISVSIDGNEWVNFPHDYTAADETVYSDNPAHWIGFGGVTPVLYHEEDNPVDPFDPAAAGGDHFDLDDLPATTLGEQIKSGGFVYIKLTPAALLENPDTPGVNFVHDDFADGPDIDGVYGKYIADESR